MRVVVVSGPNGEFIREKWREKRGEIAREIVNCWGDDGEGVGEKYKGLVHGLLVLSCPKDVVQTGGIL